MLTGEYQHNMDLKGRVTVPSKFREDLGDKFYVCKGLDGCLFLLSQAQWDKLVEKVSAVDNVIASLPELVDKVAALIKKDEKKEEPAAPAEQ